MKIEEQVCNLELSKRLKELDVEQNGLFSFWEFHNDNIKLEDRHKRPILDIYRREKKYGGAYWTKICSAFTVAELGEMLPFVFNTHRCVEGFACFGRSEGAKFSERMFIERTEADARAKMLIYLIEQGLVKP